jgi:hypothetical protein
MDVPAILSRLESFPSVLEALLAPLSDAAWRQRPNARGWSILEIVNHLVDEEVEDFRARTRSTLEDPARPWPSFDPEGVVTTRRYQDRDPRESLARFRAERARSMAWLRSLADPAWDGSQERGGRTVRAGDLFAAWGAHDVRHLQQLAKRLYELAARDGAPYSVGYAG